MVEAVQIRKIPGKKNSRSALGEKRPESLCITYQNLLGYRMEFVSFQSNPKNLDPSYKMDLDLWDCLGRVKLITKFHWTDIHVVTCNHYRD